MYYGVYSETGASVAKAPIDPEEPWVSRINLDQIPSPVSVKSLLRLVAENEGITTSCQLFNSDGQTRLDGYVFMDDGSWFGATTEDHVVLKFTDGSEVQTPANGSQDGMKVSAPGISNPPLT